jgi:putative ABC transport system permease protein
MNQFLEAVGIALSAIWANKLRSTLTVLGNIVAVTSIIAVVSLIQGMNGMVASAIVSEVGGDAFSVQRYPITRSEEDWEKARSNPQVTLRDAQAIREHSDLVAAVMAQANASGTVSYRDIKLDSVQVEGVTKEYSEFSAFSLDRGRLISPIEIDRNRPVVILGFDVADKLFEGRDPLDKTIKIVGMHFRVVGVSAKKGGFFGQSFDNFVVIPLGAHQRVFGTAGSRRGISLSVKPVDPALTRDAMDEATVALRIERRLKPKEPDNFGMFTSDTIMDLYDKATRGIFAVLVGVVALSLVVGGIVIMNIMLMVVTERTREIGLRKALGARRRDIVWQILTESITLSTVGGVIGTALGFAAAMTVARFTPLPAAVQPWSVAAGIGITALVGLFFGLYPANRAARLDPIEALRKE